MPLQRVSRLTVTSFYRLTVALLTCGVASIASAADNPTCLFVFGMCVSCDGLATCEKYEELTTKQLAPRKGPKPAARPTLRRTQSRRTRISPPKRADLNQELAQFKKFMRAKDADLKNKSDQELQELFFRYKLWTATRGNRTPIPTR